MNIKLRFACWFGFHHWTYEPKSKISDVQKRCCLRCGHVQEGIKIIVWINHEG